MIEATSKIDSESVRLKRITTMLEGMAMRWEVVEVDLEWYKREHTEYRALVAQLRSQIRGLKGTITRNKKDRVERIT